MGVNTTIEWAHHTFNPWRGCTKVSPGCANCYAETLSHRNPGTLGVWGPNGKRVVASESMWGEPLKWDRAAAKAGERRRVFCASLGDVFEDWQGPISNHLGGLMEAEHRGNAGESAALVTMDDVRTRLFRLIDSTPHLDWLLLTKRPENISRMMPACFPGGYIAEAGAMNQGGVRPNVWIGTSVEDQAAADERIPHLLKIPAAVRFLSVEPLLGPVNLDQWLPACWRSGIHWIICGGESGLGARPMHPDWVRSIRDQCETASVPFFFKQWGDLVSCWNDDLPEAVVQKIDARINLAGYDGPEWFRVGKKAAGRLLDGRTHDEVPG